MMPLRGGGRYKNLAGPLPIDLEKFGLFQITFSWNLGKSEGPSHPMPHQPNSSVDPATLREDCLNMVSGKITKG